VTRRGDAPAGTNDARLSRMESQDQRGELIRASRQLRKVPRGLITLARELLASERNASARNTRQAVWLIRTWAKRNGTTSGPHPT
jgi:hypothetical protein